MKINILTWLHNGNYGTVLQAYALQRFLINQGFDCVDINYKPSTKAKIINWIISRNSLSLFLDKFENKKSMNLNKKGGLFQEREKKFEIFRKENINLTKEYNSFHELKNSKFNADVFICGSDQIWSPKLLNPVYYFSFLPHGSKKISYATSFGVTDTSKRKKKLIKKYLDDFYAVSVREIEGANFIKKISSMEVDVTVDPTFLLSKSEWDDICKYLLLEEDYILCILLTPNINYIDEIKKFSKFKNMKVVCIPSSKGPFDTGWKEFIDISPNEWLGLIQKSKYIFTDSFHGAIFSIIFNKEFFLLKRFVDTSKISENSRIYTLCKNLSLEDRLFDSSNLQSIYTVSEIDYNSVMNLNKEIINESKNWLLQNINKDE